MKVRLIDVVLVFLLCALAGMGLSGCGTPEKAETAVLTQVDAADGMVRTIEEGVFRDGQRRPVTYDELVQYVYALRYGAVAVGYDLGLIDRRPDREALAPPRGWIVAPIGDVLRDDPVVPPPADGGQ